MDNGLFMPQGDLPASTQKSISKRDTLEDLYTNFQAKYEIAKAAARDIDSRLQQEDVFLRILQGIENATRGNDTSNTSNLGSILPVLAAEGQSPTHKSIAQFREAYLQQKRAEFLGAHLQGLRESVALIKQHLEDRLSSSPVPFPLYYRQESSSLITVGYQIPDDRDIPILLAYVFTGKVPSGYIYRGGTLAPLKYDRLLAEVFGGEELTFGKKYPETFTLFDLRFDSAAEAVHHLTQGMDHIAGNNTVISIDDQIPLGLPISYVQERRHAISDDTRVYIALTGWSPPEFRMTIVSPVSLLDDFHKANRISNFRTELQPEQFGQIIANLLLPHYNNGKIDLKIKRI